VWWRRNVPYDGYTTTTKETEESEAFFPRVEPVVLDKDERVGFEQEVGYTVAE